MSFAILREKLICTMPTMQFTHGNVLHSCFQYRMFEYKACAFCSIHMKRNLLSTCDLCPFQMLPLTELTVLDAVKVSGRIFP